MVSLLNAKTTDCMFYNSNDSPDGYFEMSRALLTNHLIYLCRYKDGKEIYKGSRKYHMEYDPVAHVASITVLHPDQSDSGRYRVEASNKFGHVDSSCKVKIHGEH